MCRLPFDLSCSSKHGYSRRAPELGAHTESFLLKKWSKVHDNAILKKTLTYKEPEKECNVLDGVTVVELSKIGRCVTSCTMHFSEMGATVIKILP